MSDICPLTFYGVAGLAALIIGLGKGGLGGMLGALVTPLMSLVLPVTDVVGMLLPMLMLADVFAVSVHRGHWHTPAYKRMAPAAAAGILIGILFLTRIPPEPLRRVLGVIALLFVLYKLFEQRITLGAVQEQKPWHALLAGSVSGFTSSLAHAGGPPAAIYLMTLKLEPRTFAATSAIFFATVNLIKLPLYLYTDVLDFRKLISLVWILPLLPIGVWLGKQLSTHIKREPFDKLLIALLALAGVMLLIR